MLRNEEEQLIYVSDNPNPRKSKSLFFQGAVTSQTQISKYIGERFIDTTTGEVVICRGRNNLKPINVLYQPFIGTEILDVNTHPFDTLTSRINPVKLFSASLSYATNWYQGIEVYDPNGEYKLQNSLNAHTLNISDISIGQETDIASHFKKYQLCLEEDPNVDLVAYGVSRGAATTITSITEKAKKGHYSEVKLVVLEGCFRSLKDTLYLNAFPPIWSAFSTGLSFFTKYHKDGPSPENCIDDFPIGLPVAFITSEIDKVVPCWSTELLANSLAARGLNDVYLLKLKNSSHPNYMFDDATDREKYLIFVHALYKRYGQFYIPEYAKKGESLLESCTLKTYNNPSRAPSM